MQSLRRRRAPATAGALAGELAVSTRTLYRDIATLKAEGAEIVGEPGLGYILRPGFFLPPLALRDDEIDAAVLGLRFVMARGDPDLACAAEQALAKITAVLPPGADVAGTPLLAPSAEILPHLGPLRRAMRHEQRLLLDYRDGAGRESRRVVWPLAVGFFESVAVLAAWCETRADFRHFRLDRIAGIALTGERMPKRRPVLLADWRRRQGLHHRE